MIPVFSNLGLEKRGLSYKRKNGMLSLTKRRLRGDMIAIFQYLKGCHREEGIDFFSMAPEGRTIQPGNKEEFPDGENH